MVLKALSVALALLSLHGSVGPASAQAFLEPTCPGAPEPVVFADRLGELENLAFDGNGYFYVSSVSGELRRFAPDGSEEILVEGDTPLGGLTFGPAGELYLGVSVGLAVPAPIDPSLGLPLVVEAGKAEVWRFDELFPPSHTVYVDRLDSANGLATDPHGNLYISGGFDQTIFKVPPGGEPTVWTTALTPNGLRLTPDQSALYAALTLDPMARILSVELDDPDQRSEVASLWNVGLPIGKGLDDMGIGPNGEIYVTTHLGGEVLRVDPTDGGACVLAVGFQEPSSAAVAVGFGAHTGKLFVTEFGGRLAMIDLGLSG
jgi:sugar lactone lactonase YvrE